MAESIAELQALTDDEVMKKHDEKAKTTYVHTQHYLDELNRRYQAQQTVSMLRFTKWIFAMTVVVTVATIVNILIAARVFG